MPVESEADRAVFTNANDFGVVAIYQPKTGGPVPIALIFDNDHLSFDQITGFPVSSVNPKVTVQSALLLNGSTPGETLLIPINGTNVLYEIRDDAPDGIGMTVLDLHKL